MIRGRFFTLASLPVWLLVIQGASARAGQTSEIDGARDGPSMWDAASSESLALAPRPRRPGAPRPSAEAVETPATMPAEAVMAEVPATQPAAPPAPKGPDDELAPLEEFEPFGASRLGPPPQKVGDFGSGEFREVGSDFLPLPDRWRIGLPPGYVQNTRGSLLDPYGQNVLKGDYPIIGDDIFLVATFVSDTLGEARRLPTPRSVSSRDAGSFDFFSQGESFSIVQSFVASFELFAGDTSYKPRDWEFRATLVENFNYLRANERQVVDIDFREGRERFDEKFSVQELFYEEHLRDMSPNYDVFTVRAGIQGFSSDFRGFLYSDNEPGFRVFGNLDNNKVQYNLIYLRQFEKDSNSGLLSFSDRDQSVFIANIYRQDFIWPGYTAQLSFHGNWDNSSQERAFDQNGFLVRPAPLGTIGPKRVEAYYLGWAGDGHIGRLNITHQFYQALGRESSNPLSTAEDGLNINAQFFAVELSYDQDYIRYRASFAYASGDRNPSDNSATGFDSIFDNPNFAGGGISFFTRQAVRLTGSGVGLTQRNSFLPDLRTSKEQGQANFVNPGLLLYNVGMDVELTPKLKLIGNATYLQFANTSSLEEILQDNKISSDIGWDLSLGLLYRPLLNNNIIVNAGGAVLIPAQGFRDLYTNETLYSAFLGVTLTY